MDSRKPGESCKAIGCICMIDGFEYIKRLYDDVGEYSVGIDKLDILLCQSVYCDYFKGERLATNKKTIERVLSKEGVEWTLFHFSNVVRKISVKPTDYSSYSTFMDGLINFMGCLFFKSRVVRCDFNIDISMKLNEVIKFMDIKFKRCSARYEDKGAKATGGYFGKAPHIINAYDKGNLIKSEKDITRIEERLSKDKLLYRECLRDFLESFKANVVGDSSLIFNKVYFQELSIVCGKETSLVNKFMLYREDLGLFRAKRLMMNRNFDRNVLKRLRSSERFEVSTLYKRAMVEWING